MRRIDATGYCHKLKKRPDPKIQPKKLQDDAAMAEERKYPP